MRRKITIYMCFLALSLLTFSCGNDVKVSYKIGSAVFMVPDYANVTIPPNIAPLNFKVLTNGRPACAIVEGQGIRLQIKATDGMVKFNPHDWQKLITACRGNKFLVTVCLKDGQGKWGSLAPFNIYVAKETCDPYVAYRLIEPAYEMWNEMGIYQRNLENYDVTPIYENKQSDKSCVNCHSFCAGNPSRMLFHVRKMHPGMVILYDGKVEKLNTKTDQTISPLVYPSWHPQGRFIAFSTNHTILAYHFKDKNAAEVYDDASDVVVYDVKKHQVFTIPALSSDSAYETFPTFSPDGRTLFFCSAPAYSMPEKYADEHYSLCSVPFDPVHGVIGTKVDTIYSGPRNGKSVSFPRVSPDGKWLMFTLHAYGSFPIWHKDADLWMMRFSDRVCYPLTQLNCPTETDSYHSWSSNSRWVVFSSRRNDGWYTRLYIGYIDRNGQPRKPFQLPQRDVKTDAYLMKSYNIPEFVKGPVPVSSYRFAETIRNTEPAKVSFRSE